MEAVGGQLLSGGEEVGDDIFAEVVGGGGVRLVVDEVLAQLGPGEHIDAHGSQVTLWLLGLLLELVDPVLCVHIHDAEAGSLFHGDLQHRDGAGRACFFMEIHHVGVVHFIDVVTG
ncbi:hypothetical protein SDC9_211340 [bioreactor metagenome]|uniref:Uncharacterized protein n=1 Tax=bioreactor metagenome TaxID=1076179 RepID=A0A645JJG7_9ZZZZ